MNTQEEILSNEELLGPPPSDPVSMGLSILGSIIAGFIGGFVILIATYIFLGSIQTSGIFPFILSLVGFFAILVTTSITLILNRLLAPNKYRSGDSGFAQMGIFSIFLFILITPVYIYVNAVKPDVLIFVFTLHIIIAILGTSLLVEILANYRYILLSLYGVLLGFIATSALSVTFFLNYSPSKTALYSLVGVIIVANFVTNAFRSIFEYLYYRYYVATGNDHLGDIFAKIEAEELEIVTKAKKELERF